MLGELKQTTSRRTPSNSVGLHPKPAQYVRAACFVLCRIYLPAGTNYIRTGNKWIKTVSHRNRYARASRAMSLAPGHSSAATPPVPVLT